MPHAVSPGPPRSGPVWVETACSRSRRGSRFLSLLGWSQHTPARGTFCTESAVRCCFRPCVLQITAVAYVLVDTAGGIHNSVSKSIPSQPIAAGCRPAIHAHTRTRTDARASGVSAHTRAYMGAIARSHSASGSRRRVTATRFVNYDGLAETLQAAYHGSHRLQVEAQRLNINQ